jgi:hypothetical protein
MGNVSPVEISLSRTHEIGYTAAFHFEKAVVKYPLNEGHRLTVGSPGRAILDNRTFEGAEEHQLTRNHGAVHYFAEQFNAFAGSWLNGGGGAPSVTSLADAVSVTEFVESCYARRERLSFTCGW